MVYLIAFFMKNDLQEQLDRVERTLTSLGGEKVLTDAWLVESDKSAQELYMTVAKVLDLPHYATLFVAEITLNSIGSHIVAARNDDAAATRAERIGALIGRARRG